VSTPFLFFKGFHARFRRIASRTGCGIAIDEPLAGSSRIRSALRSASTSTRPRASAPASCCDHATGIVIGEAAVIEDDVSILHSVTLGSSGKVSGDRHPKVAAACCCPPAARSSATEVGEGAKVRAGSVVLNDDAAARTVAGVPAQIVGRPHPSPALDMDQSLDSR
jgi:serine O-acetyltransferase